MSRYLLSLMLASFTFAVVYSQGEKRAGASTPEILVKTFVQAMRDGDETTIETIMPEVARMNQKMKLMVEKMEEKLKLEDEWKRELNKRLTSQDDSIKPPFDIEKPVKPNPVVVMRPEFTAEIIEKKVIDENTLLLVIETAESKQADKQRANWQATRLNNRWVLSVPAMKQAIDLYEKTIEIIVGSDESHRAMRQTLADLKQGKFAKYEDAEIAWKKATQVTAKMKLAGDKALTLPGPKLPSSDGNAPTTIEFRLADKLAAEGLVAMKLPSSSETVYVAKQASLNHTNIHKVTAQPGTSATIILTFNEASQPKLKQILSQSECRMLAVLIDGKLVAAPLIDSKLTDRLIIKGVSISDFNTVTGK